MLKKIALTGPESTGKTWLAKRLADHYHTVWVHEYAVDYLTKNGAEYELTDLIEITKGQLLLETNISEIATDFLFCDTDITVMKVWSKVVFNEVPVELEQKVQQHKYDLYLLCYPDIEWEEGSFRENPDDRDYLFTLYKEELDKNGFNYRIVKGNGDDRFQNAVKFVEELIYKS